MYQDPLIEKYFALIRAHTGVFKSFYQGDPVRNPPASNLPCLIISKRETRVGPLNNAEDQHEVALTLSVITDVRKDLSTERDNVIAGIAQLYDIIEGRNEDLTLKATSILDILRANLLVDAASGLRTDLESITRVDYGQAQRSPEEWTIEGRVDFVAGVHQVR